MKLYRMTLKSRLTLAVFLLTLTVLSLGVIWSHQLSSPVLAQESSAITAPEPGSVVNGVVRIDGTATIGNFQRYELYFKPVNAEDSDYTYIDQGTEEVFNGELGFWDTTLIQPGVYTLRLRVVQADGNYQEYFAENITVDPNFNPVPPPQTNPTPDTSFQPTPTAIVPTGTVPTGTVPTGTVPTGTVPTGASTDTGTIGVSRVMTGTASRTITMLGRGVATAAPDQARVRLYVTGPAADATGSVRLVNEADLQQVASTLQAAGAVLEDVRVIPFSRRPDGSGPAGEVRFTYRQPANLTSFLTDGLNRLSGNTNLRVADVTVQYGVADCATLEVQALRAAILAARARAEPMATVLNVRLGPVLSVSENVAAVPVTGSCLNMLDDTAFLPLGSDTPTQVEVAVTLAVTFVMDPTGADSATPSTVAPTPTPQIQADATPTPSAARTHNVQPGETIQSISTTYGVSVEALLAANNLSLADGQAIQPGTMLIIP